MLTPTSGVVVIAQALFYSGLVMLMVGLPVFLWFIVRACMDLRAIRRHLDGDAAGQAENPDAGARHSRPPMLSAYGR